MLSLTTGPMLDPSLRVLSLPLDMFDAPPIMCGGNGLPAGAIDIAPANVILAATPCDAPLFRDAMLNACTRSGRDVLLAHTGLFPETVDPVTADVAFAGVGRPFAVHEMIFMRRRDGSLWLVPQRVGPFIEIRSDGLALETLPPFVTWDERCDGVCRAAAEIVRIVSRRGAR